MVAVLLVGLAAAIIVPAFRRPTPPSEEFFLETLNKASMLAADTAMITATTHRVVFDLNTRRIAVEKEIKKESKDFAESEVIFEPLKGIYHEELKIPDDVTITNFFIKSKDEMAAHGGVVTTRLWYFVGPDGVGQEIKIHATITPPGDLAARPYRYNLNPITGEFAIAHEAES